jgi:hypothetical protein
VLGTADAAFDARRLRLFAHFGPSIPAHKPKTICL